MGNYEIQSLLLQYRLCIPTKVLLNGSISDIEFYYFLLTNHDMIIVLSKNHNSRYLSVFTINCQTPKQKIITIASHNGNIIQFVSLFLFHIQCSHLIQFMFSNFFISIFIFLGALSQGFTKHSRKAFVYILYIERVGIFILENL